MVLDYNFACKARRQGIPGACMRIYVPEIEVHLWLGYPSAPIAIRPPWWEHKVRLQTRTAAAFEDMRLVV